MEDDLLRGGMMTHVSCPNCGCYAMLTPSGSVADVWECPDCSYRLYGNPNDAMGLRRQLAEAQAQIERMTPDYELGKRLKSIGYRLLEAWSGCDDPCYDTALTDAVSELYDALEFWRGKRR